MLFMGKITGFRFYFERMIQANSKGKILYLTYDGLTDPLGQSQILPYIEGLVTEGYQFTIISFEKPDHTHQRDEIRQRLTDQPIDWQPLSYTKKPPVLSTVYDLVRMWRKALKLHTRVGFDLVHCRSYLPGIIGMNMKRKKQMPFLFDIRGFWIEERVEGELWNLKNPLYKGVYAYLKKTEKQMFAEASGIVSLTHRAKQEIEKKFQPRAHIRVIPCCVDTGLFNPENIQESDKAALRARLGITDEFVLIYLGSLGTWYDVEAMLRYFQEVRKTKPAKFLIVTRSDAALVEEAVIDKEVMRDIIITSAARDEVPLYIALADQGLFFYREGYSRMACSPTKLGEMMAMGLPAVGNDIGDTRMILEKYQAGCTMNTRNLSFFADDLNAHKIIEGAKAYFSLDEGVHAYSQLYGELFKGSKG